VFFPELNFDLIVDVFDFVDGNRLVFVGVVVAVKIVAFGECALVAFDGRALVEIKTFVV
jgi:hypothetical protein